MALLSNTVLTEGIPENFYRTSSFAYFENGASYSTPSVNSQYTTIYNLDKSRFRSYGESYDSPNFSDNDSITIEGSQFSIAHHSPIDDGEILTFVEGSNNDERTKAIRFPASTTAEIALYALDLEGYTSSLTDLTVSLWYRPDNTNTAAKTLVDTYSTNNDSTPSNGNRGLRIYAYSSYIYIELKNSSGLIRRYRSSVLTAEKFHHIVVVTDRGNITISPILYINGEQKSLSLDQGTATGAMQAIRSIFVGSHNVSNAEAQGTICQLTLWKYKNWTSSEIREMYNQGRRKNMLQHSQWQHITHHWELGEEEEFSSISVPNVSGYSQASENNLGSVSTVSGSLYTLYYSDLNISDASELRIAEGVLADNIVTGVRHDRIYNKVISALEADAGIDDVTVTHNSDNNHPTGSFTVIHNSAVDDDTMSETGDTFDNLGAFANQSDGSGMASSANADLIIRKSAYDYSTSFGASNKGTAYNVVFQFRTTGGTTDTSTNGYTANPVVIDVTEFGTNEDLWDKVEQAIENHGSLLINNSTGVSRTNGTFNLTTIDTGDGNTYFIQETDTGGHIDSISTAGGDAPTGSSTDDDITINGTTIHLQSSDANNGVDVTYVSNSDVWDRMKAVIDSSHINGWQVASTQSVGSNVMRFNLAASATGSVTTPVLSKNGFFFWYCRFWY